MTHKLKLLTLIRNARERLRDVAAGAAAEAEARRVQGARFLDDSKLALGTVVETSIEKLTDAQKVSDLELVSMMATSAQRAIEDAQSAVGDAKAVSDLALLELQSKERELRTADRIRERKLDQLAVAEDRAERTLNDDLVAARWRRNH